MRMFGALAVEQNSFELNRRLLDLKTIDAETELVRLAAERQIAADKAKSAGSMAEYGGMPVEHGKPRLTEIGSAYLPDVKKPYIDTGVRQAGRSRPRAMKEQPG